MYDCHHRQTSPAQTSGREILVDMEGGELTVPLFTSEEDDMLLRGGQRLGHTTEVDIPACAEKVERDLSEECGAVPSERIPVVKKRRPITREEIMVGPPATEAQRSELACLINESRDCATNLSELGRTPVLTMDIQEVPGSTPVAVRPYRANAEMPESCRTEDEKRKRRVFQFMTEDDEDSAEKSDTSVIVVQLPRHIPTRVHRSCVCVSLETLVRGDCRLDGRTVRV